MTNHETRGPPIIFDRGLLRQRRRRAAAGSDSHDFLLQRVAEDFAERIAITNRAFDRVLNLGAHTGAVSRAIRPLSNIGTVFDADPSYDMVRRCAGPGFVADEDALPIADGGLDMIVSALSLHHVNDLPGALVQICRAIRPDGMFLAAVLGGETLHELRTAFVAAEAEISGGASPRVAPFADVRAFGGLLQRAGFALPVVDNDTVKVTYASPLALMRDIKGMGASNALAERTRRPMSKALLARACESYTERNALPGGRIHATFEIITMTAWVPHESQPKPLKPGSAAVSLKSVLGG